jgi:hypothetical protein
MASLADLLVASPDDVPNILASEYPLGTYKGTNVDGLEPLNLAALQTIFTSEDTNQVLEKYQPIAEASPEGPWLIKFPDKLIECLAALAPEDHSSLAAKWASTEPLQKEGLPDQTLQQLIGQIAYFAQTASFEGQDLYLWIYR